MYGHPSPSARSRAASGWTSETPITSTALAARAGWCIPKTPAPTPITPNRTAITRQSPSVLRLEQVQLRSVRIGEVGQAKIAAVTPALGEGHAATLQRFDGGLHVGYLQAKRQSPTAAGRRMPARGMQADRHVRRFDLSPLVARAELQR